MLLMRLQFVGFSLNWLTIYNEIKTFHQFLLVGKDLAKACLSLKVTAYQELTVYQLRGYSL